MIARKHRFRGHNSVSRVRGARYSGSGFTVFYAKNDRNKDYKMAVVVSRKTSKSAVVRNRIRRRLYEAVRKNEILNGHKVDAVFVVHTADLAKEDATKLSNEVKKACEKIILPR